MKLKFSKMHGLGNDFVVIDGVGQRIEMTSELARRLADRHFGIGCDQILLVESSKIADFKYRIWNNDGSEAAECGNGARCFAHFVRAKGLSSQEEIKIETKGGIISPRFERDGTITVNMGAPIFDPPQIPFASDSHDIVQPLQVLGETIEITAVSMGNPHAIQIVRDVDCAPVQTQGPLIERHAQFPERVNAGYMQIMDRQNVRLRVWERGAGETLACGTAACAAVAAGILRGLLDTTVRVKMLGGSLTIRWSGEEGESVEMSGPAEFVYEGEIVIDNV